MTVYSQYPTHPLRYVPQEILDAAREAIQGAVEWGDVDEYMAEPIADSIVVSLLPWLQIDNLHTKEQ